MGSGTGTRLPAYVLITPARNEAAFIGQTIASVAAQSVRPVRWVIVSDGSSDGTNEIAGRAAAAHPWIEFVALPERAERNFVGKVSAFNAGLARLSGLEYEAIGNVDADISFEADYFEFLLGKLAADSRLGLVGTPYRDPFNGPNDYRFAAIEHVTGPCQLFRRQCFEDIGGYMAVKGGAVDRIADIAARMKGWKTRTYPEKTYVHYRHTGTAEQNVLMAKFRDGAKDYSVGTSPVWESFRTVYQMTKRPFVVGSLMMASGYLWSAVQRIERPVPPEMVAFCRREQMQRLKALFAGRAFRARR
jgi:glycosyltransferase involved in cell wall biosynthesis